MNRLYIKLSVRYVVLIALIPNLIFAISIYGCRSEMFESFIMLGMVLFIPMTVYYMLPSLLSGGYGFAGQMGVGPVNLFGFLIAIVFWSVIASLVAGKRAGKMGHGKKEDGVR
jgi:hypothetical protein